MKKTKPHPLYEYQKDGLSFISQEASGFRQIYAPLCNPLANGLKSSITPFLSGDIKINNERFLTKPVSREDLRENTRNFFVRVDGQLISLADALDTGRSSVEVGPFWHRLCKKFIKAGIELEAVNFIPASGEHLELMKMTITNVSRKKISCQPTAAVPVFGRALSNKHDHEHVTALLHRIRQVRHGVLVEHVMSFDEEGHQENDAVYYVLGATQSAGAPTGSYPTRESFLGEGGTLERPQALIHDWPLPELNKTELNGKEAMGALHFGSVSLKPSASFSYIIAMGVASHAKTPPQTFAKFNTLKKFDEALSKTKSHWLNKGRSIEFSTGCADYDSWLKWVTYQPVLRRIFGCSFLPDHDYGKGGKGWRDIWQDLLSLILIEPEEVREALINNFAGVRIDGSNATIIGENHSEFMADRNKITRVWMDHGAWPLLTLAFYIDQTGDLGILLKRQSYFRDVQLSRTFHKDDTWHPAYGQKLKDKKGKIYKGTILEHLLVQTLVQFFNVGEHNMTRLESADWNDGLDMAFDRGESVAFTSFYGGNLFVLADLLERLSATKNITHMTIAREIKTLLDSLTNVRLNYNNPRSRQHHICKRYFVCVQPQISGQTLEVALKDVVRDLRKKGQWIFETIRRQEKIRVGGNSWFNGYYDNKGVRLEGRKANMIRMTLTGQVFPIMSGLANDKEIRAVIRSVNKYLKDKELGGYRLNTDFGLRHYLDLGRAFSFAYGTKENGAFFCHMTVMYAYALYKRGFAKEGYDVLQSIYHMCLDTDKSRIYPGIPEYFDSQGRGMYHYLTGSASWLILTKLTQAFGVRGRFGDLVIAPKLMKEEFGKDHTASARCDFAGKRLRIVFENKHRLNFGQYRIVSVRVNGKPIGFMSADDGICIDRKIIQQARQPVTILVVLS